MKLKRHVKLAKGLEPINIAPLIDVIFQLLIFFMLTSSFTYQTGIHVKLPKAVTSDTINDENYIITITSENVLYRKDQVITIKELEEELSQPNNKIKAILIKADRRSSMGRIVDVWDLCRSLGIEKINIATNRDSS